MHLSIRKARLEDVPILTDIEMKSLGPIWKKEKIDYKKDYLFEHIEQGVLENNIVIIERRDSILAFSYSIIYEDVVTGAIVKEISTLAVHPDHLGEGLGSLLLEQEERDAIEKKVNIIKLEVLSRNKRALRFYEKDGFVEKKKIMVKKLSDNEENNQNNETKEND